ncbi:hypothetical protein [Nocardiopsis sp. CA-288880]|uniref:hypothetical protein n=1 Tax=Nocardiopsis sp. CA-288880 TaxID=3239995 RepID=UPI003D98A5F4
MKNRLTGDVSGSALQIGVVHGDVSVSGGPDADVARQVLDMLLTGTALPPGVRGPQLAAVDPLERPDPGQCGR